MPDCVRVCSECPNCHKFKTEYAADTEVVDCRRCGTISCPNCLKGGHPGQTCERANVERLRLECAA